MHCCVQVISRYIEMIAVHFQYHYDVIQMFHNVKIQPSSNKTVNIASTLFTSSPAEWLWIPMKSSDQLKKHCVFQQGLMNKLNFNLCDSAALQGFHKGLVFFWASWFCTKLKHSWLKNVGQGVWLLSPFGRLPTCPGLPLVLFPLKDKYPPIIPVILIIAHWCYHHLMTSHHHLQPSSQSQPQSEASCCMATS